MKKSLISPERRSQLFEKIKSKNPNTNIKINTNTDSQIESKSDFKQLITPGQRLNLRENFISNSQRLNIDVEIKNMKIQLKYKDIPKNIYLCYKTKNIPSHIIPVWKLLNPGYQVHLFDNADCENFLLNNFGQEYVNIFRYIKDGPIKADFWRCCVLYINGGIYSDIDIELIEPIDDFLEKDATFMTCISMFNGLLNPHIIACPKEHHILKACIDTYVKFYRQKKQYEYWGWSIVYIMGAIIKNIFGEFYKEEGIYYDSNGNSYQFIKEIFIDGGVSCYYKNHEVLKNRTLIYNEKEHQFVNNIYDYNPNFKNCIIPLKVYHHWHTKDLPPIMKQKREKLIRDNPEFEFELYDNDDCREFIKNNFDRDVLYAFDSLIPGAYKADLWRYCVIYKSGGIYLDIAIECTNNFKLKYLTDSEYFVKDITWNNVEGLWNAVMICKKNNPILLDAINKVVENVKNKYYGQNSLCPTGPVLLFNSYSKYNNNRKFNLYLKKNNVWLTLNSIPIIKKYDEYRIEQKLNKDYISFYELWHDKLIYNWIQYNKSIIPLKVYQTWHTKDLPPIMKENRDKLIKQNPEFEFELYDDYDCRKFIEDNFDRDVLYAFDSVIPGAYKADLWRYCILYKYGGIYLDIAFECLHNFKLIYLTDDEYFVRDRDVDNYKGIYNALLICKSKNPILLDAINHIVENVKTKYYGINPLWPTGPALLYQSYSKFYNDIDNLILLFNGDGNGITYNNNIYILDKYKEYRDEQKKVSDSRTLT